MADFQTADINQFVKEAKKRGMSDYEITQYLNYKNGVVPEQAPAEETITDKVMKLAPTAGSIIGGIGGSLVGGPVGGVIGAGLGGAAGETARQAYTPEDDTDWGKVATEGAWGAGGELVGIGAGKLLGKAANWVGSKVLPEAAENIATKNLGKSAVRAFQKKAGSSLGEKMIEHGVVGKSAEEIAEKAAQEGAKYEAVIASSNTAVSPYEIFEQLMKQAEKYLGNANPAVHAKGEALQQIAEGTVNQYAKKALLTPAEVLAEKRLVAEVLSNTAYDEGVKKAVNTVHEDILRNILNKAVPQAKALGQNQRDLIEMARIVKGAEQLGQGGRTIPLVPMLGAGAGSVAGGPLGAIGGVVAAGAANSPRVTQALANVASKSAPAIAGMGQRMAADTATNAFLRTLGGQSAANLFRGVAAPQGVAPQPVEGAGVTGVEEGSVAAPVSELGAEGLTEEKGNSSILDMLGMDEQKFLKAYVLNPSNKSLKAIFDMYQMEKKEGQKTTKKSAEVARYEDASSQLAALESFIDRFASKMGPVKGRISAANVYDPDAQELQAQIKAVAQIVGIAMEKGVLRKEDIPKYEAILPNIKDTPEVAKRKIANVRVTLARSARNLSSIPSGDTTVLDTAAAVNSGAAE